MFFIRQILVKATPGDMTVSSGIVTSMGFPAVAWSHTGDGVRVDGGAVLEGGDGVCWGLSVGEVGMMPLSVCAGVSSPAGFVSAALVSLAFTVWYAWVAFNSLGVSESAASDELQPTKMMMVRTRNRYIIEREEIFMGVKRRLGGDCSIHSAFRVDNFF